MAAFAAQAAAEIIKNKQDAENTDFSFDHCFLHPQLNMLPFTYLITAH